MNITPNQWTILESLKDGPRWTRSYQTTKPLVHDLVERGLIERCRPARGTGCNMIRLTSAGCAKLEIDPADVPKNSTGTERIAPRSRCSIREDATQLARATCQAFLRAVGCGAEVPQAVANLAERYGVERPAIWRRLRSGGVLAAYQEKRHRPYIPRDQRKVPVRVLPAPVHRDPCPRCGVRGDIGCGHSQTRLGMVL